MENESKRLIGEIDADIRRLKKRMWLHILGLVTYIVAFGLCLYWYDWRLFLLIFMFQTGNNISLAKKLEE